MKFGDTDLDAFVQDVVKLAVKDGIGYDLVWERGYTHVPTYVATVTIAW